MAENCMSFREVVQKKGFPIRWKEITVNTGGSGSTIQDLKVPESAGGYVFRDGNRLQSYARNRFIYWRVHKDTLELVELSLDNDLHGNAIRLHFQDSAILGDISIFESRGEVVFLVATVSSVHRLVFPHPSSLQHQMSIFTDASVVNLCEPSDCHSISPVSNVAYSLHAAGAWLTTEGEALFALATSTGSILFIKLPPKGIQGIVTQHELKHASMMQRLWTGLVPAMIRGGPSEADMAESVCLHYLGQDVFIFAICRDHKLRMWSCKNQECVLVSDMLDFIPDKLDPLKGTIGARGHVIRKSVEGNMLHLGVFLNFSDRNQFCIFQPVLADGRYQLNLITTVFAPNEDLVEFSLTNTHLWSLWTTSESETVVRYAALDDSDNFSYDPWNMVHLQQPESPEVIVPLHREPRETYMDYIFYPGRFTAQTISKALNIYRRSLDSLMGHGLHISSQVLREEVTAAVENEVGGCLA
ncbi:nuclear pore complex protein Nup160-like isoform X1 [Lingula anatina]|uniref:Nuclear pore complex protein Nup160-like isoform X1 n=1 Tax=Lingula anatina TaxID=7574 RepID=A0A1S3I5K7_LINAN|nr:nuclear pore complex protein Nup160-like isoform X1 [Lingula anatina]|eukprot:XP_013393121.1 nuclear pore complex protein Nup160-like isoform X1 [Lingula anatina]